VERNPTNKTSINVGFHFIQPNELMTINIMKDLTCLMQEYRLCLRIVWNTFLATECEWDDRDYFYNAAVQLFKAIVLFSFDDVDRKSEILPAYCSNQKPFMPICVTTISVNGILVSKSGIFYDTEDLSSEIQLDEVDLRYVDLYDFNELSFREFKYVKAEIVASQNPEQIGYRLLIPFESVRFEKS